METNLYYLTFPNGKGYAGISTNPRRRLNQHVSNSNRKSHAMVLYEAIRKYGRPTLVVLASGTKEEMCDLEVMTIEFLELRNREYGYNLCRGGTWGGMGLPGPMLGRTHSEETKLRMRKSHQKRAILGLNRGNPQPHSEESKRKISESLKGRPSPTRGRMQTVETRIKISESVRNWVKMNKLYKG